MHCSSILRKEAETYQDDLAKSHDETESYKQKQIDLENLISKTRDSLVDEKKRVTGALEEKDTQIAQLDRDLAEKLNDIHSTKSTLEKTNKKLTKMTSKFNTQKNRADTLDEKIQKLNQLSSMNNMNNNDADVDSSSKEVDRLTKLLEDVTKSNDEYKTLMTTYDDKVTFLSQQLLLSGQNLSNKQNQVENLKQELVEATSNAQVAVEDQKSTVDEVSVLKTKLDEVQSKSTVWKAQANGMIVQLTNDLKERDVKLAKLSEEQQQQQENNTGNKALEKEIAALKSAMEESQMKAKEKMKHKNQSLAELEETVTKLSAEMEDLKREKDQITDRLNEEMKRGKDDYDVHERQLRKIEDRLAKEHIAEIAELENEMNETIQELTDEIETLKKSKSQQGAASTTVKSTRDDYKVQEMEQALRRSKEQEVSLINRNMQMQNKIQDLQHQAQERVSSGATKNSVFDDESMIDDNDEKSDLPTYFKERQRPVVIRVVGNALRKVFRRKKKL